MEAAAPCRTLYVRNLPEKVKKARLKKLLHAAFSPHGRVVWIVAENSLKLRGQAFVTFEHQSFATAALRKMHATEFMGRQMLVMYSKTLSDRAGSAKLGGESELSRKKRASKRKLESENVAKRAKKDAVPSEATVAQIDEVVMQESILTADEPPPQIVAPVVPNRILFVEKLPKKIEKDGKPISISDVLSDLFGRFSGFVEVRTVPGKDCIAFVEFSNESESSVAMSGLREHPIGDPPVPMKISFAKK